MITAMGADTTMGTTGTTTETTTTETTATETTATTTGTTTAHWRGRPRTAPEPSGWILWPDYRTMIREPVLTRPGVKRSLSLVKVP